MCDLNVCCVSSTDDKASLERERLKREQQQKVVKEKVEQERLPLKQKKIRTSILDSIENMDKPGSVGGDQDPIIGRVFFFPCL